MKAPRLPHILAAGLGLVALPAAVLLEAGLGARPAPADLAIVFGNTVLPSGQPSARLQARLEAALALYRGHLAPRLLVSGGTGVEGRSEAQAMRAYLVDRGVPADSVLLDEAGVTTRATCQNAATLAQATGLRTVDVITQYFHIPRAALACRQAGLVVVGGVWPRFLEARDLYSVARELIAYPLYRLQLER